FHTVGGAPEMPGWNQPPRGKRRQAEEFGPQRPIPNPHFWRPARGVGTAAARSWAVGSHDCPTAPALTRQNVDHNERTPAQVRAIARGGYVLHEPEGDVQAIVIGTGSELELAVAAAKALNAEGKGVRVVSMPCIEAFLAQDRSYRDDV